MKIFKDMGDLIDLITLGNYPKKYKCVNKRKKGNSKRQIKYEERRDYQKRYYQEHKEKAKEYQRLYNLRHKKRKGKGRRASFECPREAARMTYSAVDLMNSYGGKTERMLEQILSGDRLFTM